MKPDVYILHSEAGPGFIARTDTPEEAGEIERDLILAMEMGALDPMPDALGNAIFFGPTEDDRFPGMPTSSEIETQEDEAFEACLTALDQP